MGENPGQGLQTAPAKERFSIAIQSDMIQSMINNTLGDKKRSLNFIASISAVVSTNPALQDCDYKTVINAALLGEALKLAPSPQLGYFYMIPFKQNKYNPQTKSYELERIVATFVLGYKGYIQLAIRSGYYKHINVISIKKGELISWDPMTEEIKVNLIQDDQTREQAETVGFYASFEYLNGFTKSLYWSYQKMLAHAEQYSEAFNAASYALFKAGKTDPKDKRKYSSFWYTQFDDMAAKTMLRQLISKWGILSVEMQTAFENDSTFQDENGKPVYPEVPPTAENVVATVKNDVQDAAGKTPIPTEKKEEPKLTSGPALVVDQQTGEVKAVSDKEAAEKLAAMQDGVVQVKMNF